VLVSAVSAWEIATKVRLGRLEAAADLARDFGGYLARERFESLSISTEHGIRAGSLPGAHKDPFDRILVAQAQIESLLIVSNDSLLDGYGVSRTW
jgi:PIN domain nuclease of toxin-antitoxin system